MSFDATNVWGPSVLPGDKWYLFKGEQHQIPITWENVNKMMGHLKDVEKMEWVFALPDQQRALFNKKLEVLTRNLPPNWTMIVGTTICGIVIVIQIAAIARAN